MNEVKSTFKRLALYAFFLLLNIFPSIRIIPDSFPTRNVSVLYLLGLSVCLVLYVFYRTAPRSDLKRQMMAIAVMVLTLIVLRGLKYSIVCDIGVLARHAWYLYYCPMLLIPQFLLNIALLVYSRENEQFSAVWHVTRLITVLLIVLIATNDLHQQAFAFKPGFMNWDSDYSHEWAFYAAVVWEYVLYIMAVTILVVKCSLSNAKRYIWIIILQFAIGITLRILLVVDRMPKVNGCNIIEFPETIFFMVAGILECCAQLGLIPTNERYSSLFKVSAVASQITDEEGRRVYSSDMALPLEPEMINAPEGTRIGEHAILHRMKLPGGYGFWQDDVTELDRLNAQLKNVGNKLSGEIELTRLKNELDEKQSKIEHRTNLYDKIAKKVQPQSMAITKLAEEARNSDSVEVRSNAKKHITLLGAYIKRYANLMLLSADTQTVDAGELGISIAEVLHYLNLSGIPGEVICSTKETVRSDVALLTFEAFEDIIEPNIADIAGVFVSISDRGERVLFKLTIENYNAVIPRQLLKELTGLEAGVSCEFEDGVSYICFSLKKGGAVA